MRLSPSRILGVGLLVIVASAGLAQTVSFISPQNGATVRGVLELHATKPNPSDGWISYKVGQAGQDGNYVSAVITPFNYKWDTRQHTAEGGRVYPDGDYVIIATAYDSSASVVGEATVTITLQNELTPAEVEEPVTLKVSYDKARKLDFAADGKLLVTLPEEEKKKLGIPLRLDLVVKANWTSTVLSASSEESVLDELLKSGYIQVAGSEGYQLPGAGDTFREKITPDGAVEPLRSKREHFALGEYYVKLPDRPISRGETWNSELSVLPLPNAVSRQILPAQNRLDGFEYVAGRKCARIITTFSEKNTLVMVRVGSQVLPIKTSYEARRASYFGLTDHHFIGFEEKMRHTIEIPVAAIQMLFQLQMASSQKAQAGAGMPGAGGMMGGGMGGMMGGGMASPGMGGGTMAGGMMGGGGMGMGGMGTGMTPGMGGMGGGYTVPGGGMMGGGTGTMGGGMPGTMGGMPGSMGGMGGMGGMGTTAQPQTAHVTIDSELRIMEAAVGGKSK